MSFVRQRTLKAAVGCSGVGLHCGSEVSVTLHPAAPNSGIRFLRTDCAGGPVEIPATWRHALETPLCTTLVGPDDVRVATIEHLMSAFAGCGVDNAVVEIDGPEVPAMDGSALPFVTLIERTGTVEQASARWALQVLKPITVREPHRVASVSPADSFKVDFEIFFDTPAIGRQAWSIEPTPESYAREVAPARTFGFLQEVDHLRSMGLARGGSLDNAVVIHEDQVMNDEGLRFENEFVRHKVLDAIGDLLLIGAPLLGHFQGVRAGHSLTLRLLDTLLTDRSAWCWSKLEDQKRLARVAAAGGALAAGRAVAATA